MSGPFAPNSSCEFIVVLHETGLTVQRCARSAVLDNGLFMLPAIVDILANPPPELLPKPPPRCDRLRLR